MFSTHVRSEDTNADNGALAIKKNDVVISKLWVTSNVGGNIPSSSVVTHLVPGDEVKVTGDDSDTAKINADYKGFNGIQVDTD